MATAGAAMGRRSFRRRLRGSSARRASMANETLARPNHGGLGDEGEEPSGVERQNNQRVNQVTE